MKDILFYNDGTVEHLYFKKLPKPQPYTKTNSKYIIYKCKL